jgi:serine/threonine-protein kinase RsbW
VSDEVRLAVPATPEFVRLARVTAAGLASRLGFTFDDVDDLRLAIDELLFALVGSKGRTGTVQLRYLVQGNGLEVIGVGHFTDDGKTPGLNDFSGQILDALVDEHDLTSDNGVPEFRLVKRRQ